MAKRATFQFLIGNLKSWAVESGCYEIDEFQFLIGNLKSLEVGNWKVILL